MSKGERKATHVLPAMKILISFCYGDETADRYQYGLVVRGKTILDRNPMILLF